MENLSRLSRIATLFGVFICAAAAYGTAQDCPELVGRWPYGPANAVAVSGDYAYFDSGAVLRVADVSNPAEMQIVGEVFQPDLIQGVAVSGSYAYLAVLYAGLRVVDVRMPSAPIDIGSYNTIGTPQNIAVFGDYVDLADGDAGIEIFSPLACPGYVPTLPSPRRARWVPRSALSL